MTDAVWKYFLERYRKCDFRVVPGHWPDFKSKEDVDQWIQSNEKLSDAIFEDESEEETQDECHVCPGGGIVFIDPPRRLDAELLRGIEEMAAFYLRKYGKKTHTMEEETQMKKRYKVMFNLEGAIEVIASCEDDAEEMVVNMDRGDLLKDYDEYGFTVTSCEMDEGE